MQSYNKLKSTILFSDMELRYVWSPYTDTVTGGTSTAIVKRVDNYLSFTGIITNTSNGSWASLRSNAVEQNLEDFTGVEIKFKSDGRPYAFEMEYKNAWQDPKLGYMMHSKAHEWTIIRIPFTDFNTVHLNKVISTDINKYALSQINRFNFFVAEKILGPFELNIEYITFY